MSSLSLFPKGKGPHEVETSSFLGGPHWYPSDHIGLRRDSRPLAKLPCGSFTGRDPQKVGAFVRAVTLRAEREASHVYMQESSQWGSELTEEGLDGWLWILSVSVDAVEGMTTFIPGSSMWLGRPVCLLPSVLPLASSVSLPDHSLLPLATCDLFGLL